MITATRGEQDLLKGLCDMRPYPHLPLVRERFDLGGICSRVSAGVRPLIALALERK
jgi:hypothetical protein